MLISACLIAIEDGGYESASDYDEETLALITREEHDGDDSDHETQYMAPEYADKYECLVAQRVLSVQVTQDEQIGGIICSKQREL